MKTFCFIAAAANLGFALVAPQPLAWFNLVICLSCWAIFCAMATWDTLEWAFGDEQD